MFSTSKSKVGDTLFIQGWGLSAQGIQKTASSFPEKLHPILVADFSNIDKYWHLSKEKRRDLQHIKAELLVQFLFKHQNNKRFTIIGHSEGGIVATYVAEMLMKKNRLKRLVLVTPAGIIVPASFNEQIQRFFKAVFYHFTRNITFPEIYSRIQYATHVVWYVSRNPIQSILEGQSLSRLNITNNLSNLTQRNISVDIIGYKNDIIFNPKDLLRNFRNSGNVTFHQIEGGHHAIYIHPKEFAEKLDKILTK